MNKKISTMFMFSILTVVFFLAIPAFASSMESQMKNIWSQPAAAMIGASVRNNDGHWLGRVENVVTDEDGHPTYLIVGKAETYWGSVAPSYLSPVYWQTDERLVPIPVSAVVHNPETSLNEREAYQGSLIPWYVNGYYVYNPETLARADEKGTYARDENAPFLSPTLGKSDDFYVQTPEAVAHSEGIYWGDLKVSSDAYPNAVMHRTDVNNAIYVNISMERFAKAPSFSGDEWNRFAKSDFQKQTHAYFEEE